MKIIKKIASTTSALIAMAALFWASSAMATSTQLCTSDPAGETCPAGTEVGHEHWIDPLDLLKTEGLFAVDLLCEALYLSDSLGLGAPTVSHGQWSYGAPHNGGKHCVHMLSNGTTDECGEVKQVSASALTEALKTATEEAEVKVIAEVLVECSGLHCIFKSEGLKGAGKGSLLTGTGTTGEVSIVEQEVKKVSGFACPTTAKLTMHLKSLVPLYIRR